MSLRKAIGIGAFASVLLLGSSAAWAGDLVNASDLKWAPFPGLPKGAQLAVVSGDPAGKDLYVVRLRMPGGYKIPARSHPTTEYGTVLSGTLHVGMDDKLDTN